MMKSILGALFLLTASTMANATQYQCGTRATDSSMKTITIEASSSSEASNLVLEQFPEARQIPKFGCEQLKGATQAAAKAAPQGDSERVGPGTRRYGGKGRKPGESVADCNKRLGGGGKATSCVNSVAMWVSTASIGVFASILDHALTPLQLPRKCGTSLVPTVVRAEGRALASATDSRWN